MIVNEQTTNLPWRAHPSDFDFARRVIQELEAIPTKEKVTFPLPSRNSAFADIECTLAYDSNHKPYAEFFFRSKRHGLEMAHSAVVLCAVVEGMNYYQVQITPNSKLRRAGHRKLTRNYNSAKETAIGICRNYAVGTVGRKVIPIVEKQAA